jgi:hypothetical protein
MDLNSKRAWRCPYLPVICECGLALGTVSEPGIRNSQPSYIFRE